ncbi:MAG: putative toxin-antitoxin system toxin component, PIN family [Oscillatoria sp. PMC 1051.18]|nr:putative toxin-antitoxin system toxin component, PIN family [Oscillatoria sp. PMC 1050.18]MEC5030956.1 putative toxin-antitoxin system toxin component, PIN family [Oscillatoria sp. PMC 1051.18]
MNSRLAVIDTNVFIGALLGKDGANRKIIRLCLEGKIKPLIGNALFSEYESLLNREELFINCPLNQQQRNDLLDSFLSVCRWIKIYYLWRPNLKDEADNHIIELAVAGSAEFIITNNIKDFQNEQITFSQIIIITPTQILQNNNWD